MFKDHPRLGSNAQVGQRGVHGCGSEEKQRSRSQKASRHAHLRDVNETSLINVKTHLPDFFHSRPCRSLGWGLRMGLRKSVEPHAPTSAVPHQPRPHLPGTATLQFRDAGAGPKEQRRLRRSARSSTPTSKWRDWSCAPEAPSSSRARSRSNATSSWWSPED